MDKLNIGSIRSEYINMLKLYEKQFQLVASVRLACSIKTQPLLVPDIWIYGKYKLEGQQIQLTPDSADEASAFLEHTVIYAWAIHLLNAISEMMEDPGQDNDQNIVAAFQISRLMRNAYAHSPFIPKWTIKSKFQNKIYVIQGVISVDTTNLNNKNVEWKHYGGFIALWNLSKWVRVNILNDKEQQCSTDNTYIPSKIIQQGRLILNRNCNIPKDAERIPLTIKEIDGKQYAVIGSDSDGEYKIQLNEKKDNVELYKLDDKIYIHNK